RLPALPIRDRLGRWDRLRGRTLNRSPKELVFPLQLLLERGLEVWAVLQRLKDPLAVDAIPEDEDRSGREVAAAERLLAGQPFVFPGTVVPDIQGNSFHGSFLRRANTQFARNFGLWRVTDPGSRRSKVR